MSSWDFLPKSGIYAAISQRLRLLCFYVSKIDFNTEMLFALDLPSLLIVRMNNVAIFQQQCSDIPKCALKVYGYKKCHLICQIPVTVTTNKDYHASLQIWIRYPKLLTCFVIYRAKQQLMMHFIQNLSLDFHSFLDLYLNGRGSSVDNNRWYRISTSYWLG